VRCSKMRQLMSETCERLDPYHLQEEAPSHARPGLTHLIGYCLKERFRYAMLSASPNYRPRPTRNHSCNSPKQGTRMDMRRVAELQREFTK
jgi:hypothetical protein